MNYIEARRILQLSETDDFPQIKKKYRLLMGRYHPDVLGEASSEHMRRAQEINEAYQFLKNNQRNGRNTDIYGKKNCTPKWKGKLNESAFCERNIYAYYSMDVEVEGLYYKMTRGKYLWDPDEEELHLFISSIHHATKELLERIEEKYPEVWTEKIQIKEQKFKIQADLFYSIIQQFVHPIETLRKLAEPEKEDGAGRKIYCFQAHIGTKGYDKVYKSLERLQKGDAVYPVNFENNKIVVTDKEGNRLGHLSFEDDSLYFCVIPLLKRKAAQVKLIVERVQTNKKHRPYSIKVQLRFYLRVEKGAGENWSHGSEQNLRIAELLNRYESVMRG